MEVALESKMGKNKSLLGSQQSDGDEIMAVPVSEGENDAIDHEVVTATILPQSPPPRKTTLNSGEPITLNTQSQGQTKSPLSMTATARVSDVSSSATPTPTSKNFVSTGGEAKSLIQSTGNELKSAENPELTGDKPSATNLAETIGTAQPTPATPVVSEPKNTSPKNAPELSANESSVARPSAMTNTSQLTEVAPSPGVPVSSEPKSTNPVLNESGTIAEKPKLPVDGTPAAKPSSESPDVRPSSAPLAAKPSSTSLDVKPSSAPSAAKAQQPTPVLDQKQTPLATPASTSSPGVLSTPLAPKSRPDTESALDPDLKVGTDDRILPISSLKDSAAKPKSRRRKRPAAKSIVLHKIAVAYAPASCIIQREIKRINAAEPMNKTKKQKVSYQPMGPFPIHDASAVARASLPKARQKVIHMPIAAMNQSTPPRAKPAPKKRGPSENVEVWSGPPDDNLPGGWPPGWTKKIFERRSSSITTKGGRDRYWFTPVHQLKLRSMVTVKRFLENLKETNGDEKAAHKMLKNK